jgi:hypothetical protein
MPHFHVQPPSGSKKNRFYIGAIIILVIVVTVSSSREMNEEKKPDCPSIWGSSFEGVHHSRLVNMTCQLEGYPICCRLVDSEPYPRKVYEGPLKLRSVNECELKKEYIPSAYELAHIAKAKEIDALTTEEERKKELTEYVLADLPHVSRWLARVDLHMHTTKEGVANYGKNKTYEGVPITEDDFTYLSRFQYTRKCEKEPSIVW